MMRPVSKVSRLFLRACASLILSKITLIQHPIVTAKITTNYFYLAPTASFRMKV